MKPNFALGRTIMRILLFISLQSGAVLASEELLTAYCQSQTNIESAAELEAILEIPSVKLLLSKDERINGIAISKNKRFVALDVFDVVATKTSRFIIVSPKEKVIQSYNADFGKQQERWCADIGAIGDTGEFVAVNIATPIDGDVRYRWCIVRLKDFSVVEEGLDRMLEKWK